MSIKEAKIYQSKRNFLLAFVVALTFTVLSTIIDQWIHSRIEVNLQSDQGFSSELFSLVGLSLFNTLFFPPLIMVSFLWYLTAAQKVQLLEFLAAKIQLVWIETLRGWGSVLRWSLLFVVPGLVRNLQLTFIPFVVCLNSSYQNGQADALESSVKVFSRKWILTTVVVVFFIIVLPILSSVFLDEWKTYSITPISALLCNLTDVAVFFASTYFIYRIYQKGFLENAQS